MSTVIELSGGPVEYRLISGSTALAPLVFLHEGLGCAASWSRFPDRLAGHTGRAALVYSRHGYGASGPAVTPRTRDYLHHEALLVLPELLGHLGIRTPVLIGHSEGASIALLHAARFPVDRVVAIAPHAFVESSTLQGIRNTVTAFEEGTLRQGLARLHDDPDTMFSAWSDIWLSPSFRQWDITSELHRVDVPVLVMQGLDDPYGSVAQPDAVEHAVRGLTWRADLPGCGHVPHAEQPDEVFGMVDRFLLVRADAAQQGLGLLGR